MVISDILGETYVLRSGAKRSGVETSGYKLGDPLVPGEISPFGPWPQSK